MAAARCSLCGTHANALPIGRRNLVEWEMERSKQIEESEKQLT
jgi:hypothetical protein